MVVRQLRYIACDRCGDPEEPHEDSKTALQAWKAKGGARRRYDGKTWDLCPNCEGLGNPNIDSEGNPQ